MIVRPLDAAGVRSYLHEIRPRLLTVRVHAGRMRFAWAVPSWAVEEPLRCALRLAPLLNLLAPVVTRRFAGRLGIAAGHASGRTDAAAQPDWWAAVDEAFSEAHRDLLALPGDAPLIDIDAKHARIVIRDVRL